MKLNHFNSNNRSHIPIQEATEQISTGENLYLQKKVIKRYAEHGAINVKAVGKKQVEGLRRT